MSALFDELEKQARGLSPQEKASLARILIEELDPAVDAGVEQLWIDEAQRRPSVITSRIEKDTPSSTIRSGQVKTTVTTRSANDAAPVDRHISLRRKQSQPGIGCGRQKQFRIHFFVQRIKIIATFVVH